MKKTRAFLALALALSLLLCGCSGLFGEDPKTFSKAGMSITLDEGFMERELISYTAVYESVDIAVFALKEEFSLFEGTGYGANTTLKEYAELVIEANGIDCRVTTEGSLTGFRYEKEAGGKEVTYCAYVYKSSDAFWLVQFSVVSSQYEKNKDKIADFAASVTFDK